MFCERTRRVVRGWLAGLLAATVLLCLPAPGLAADRSSAGDELATTGTLARGAGYGSHGSEPVRELQRRLRQLGDRPGPVDGLYGPLTQGAVGRFQQAHGLATDGVVGPRTKARLLALGAERPVADTSRPTHEGKLTRKSPAGDNPAESATEQNPARSAPSESRSRAAPRPVQEVPPELLLLLVVLASVSLLIALRAYGRRTREAWVNFGMVCAALLAMFVIGAATGAVFATQAAPDAHGGASADSGALLAGGDAASHRATGDRPMLARLPDARSAKTARGAAAKPRAAARRARPAASRRHAGARNAAPARVAAPTAPAAEPSYAPAPNPPRVYATPTPSRLRAPVQRPAPTADAATTYTVQPGDALWPIAERYLGPTSSVAQVAQKVELLETLNADRIASGDPDVLAAGEQLRLR